MKLSRDLLSNKEFFKKNNIQIPKYDLNEVIENTKNNTTWVHFGAGNIFRGFIGNAQENLLNKGLANTGIIAVETFDTEVIEKIYKPFDNLTLLVKMKSNGEFVKNIIGSITEGIVYSENISRLESIFENDSLQMASFTVTEKGYSIKTSNNDFMDIVKDDIKNGPEKQSIHLMSIVASLLYKRFKKGRKPLALVSMDNCSHNGDKLRESILSICKAWNEKGFVDSKFLDYLSNDKNVSFPLSMIDKITPRPSDEVKSYIEKLGFTNMDVVITSKNTYIAPFVNAEISEYLVIEDKFPNGRPKLEEVGVIFTDRDTVNNVETMKVTTCLNPLHTALAVSGCLLGYTSIWEEMENELLLKLISKIGYEEGLKVVVDPKIINPKDFIDEVINERFKNPYIPDTPQRIATDTSQKVGIRFGETIKSYMKDKELKSESLKGISLAIAMWCRYLVGIDDNGNSFDLSPDPMMNELKDIIGDAKIGDYTNIKPILSDLGIFDFDIYGAGLGEQIQEMFDFMMEKEGNVLELLKKI